MKDNYSSLAIIMHGICRLVQEDCDPSAVEQALTYISYIGTSISIVSLVLTLVTLVVFK